MSTDELEMLMQLFNQLGQTGSEAFFWWLTKDFAETILGCGMGLAVLFTVYKLFTKINGAASEEARQVEDYQRLRDAMNIGVPGRITQPERDAMLRWVFARRDQS